MITAKLWTIADISDEKSSDKSSVNSLYSYTTTQNFISHPDMAVEHGIMQTNAFERMPRQRLIIQSNDRHPFEDLERGGQVVLCDRAWSPQGRNTYAGWNAQRSAAA